MQWNSNLITGTCASGTVWSFVTPSVSARSSCSLNPKPEDSFTRISWLRYLQLLLGNEQLKMPSAEHHVHGELYEVSVESCPGPLYEYMRILWLAFSESPAFVFRSYKMTNTRSSWNILCKRWGLLCLSLPIDLSELRPSLNFNVEFHENRLLMQWWYYCRLGDLQL